MHEFKLSAYLSGHEGDVRCVLYPTAKLIISASRDKTTRLWKLIPGVSPTFLSEVASHSGHWLNTLAYLPPNQEYPAGLIFSGGKDLVIEVRKPSMASEENSEALLIGHSNTICSLDLDPAGKFVVSGAWDNEARVWPIGKWECQSILEGHEGSVWAVLAYDSETIITGCADQKIRVYDNLGKRLKSFEASKTPIRALCRLSASHPSGGDFASADNDGVICFWTINGKKKGEARGHDNFIYSLATLPTGELVSSGEDRTLRIWNGSQCIQTITHPAVSVWSVAVCPETGDIVSGASDNMVRVFTRSEDRVAAQDILENFENSVKSSSIPMPDIDKENLPGPEFLVSKVGTKDGQVQMIREENRSVTAHTWSEATSSWILVGTVVDSVGSNGHKQVYNDKEYDFVFDVDIEDGKPPLKLPYNLSENPYEAAANFIKINEAPVSYLDQVANFIIQNTEPVKFGQSNRDNNSSDPWGSENRYRPGESESTATVAANIAPRKILPQKEYLNITVARLPAIKKKIEELNAALITSNQKELSLNSAELSILSSLSDSLKSMSLTEISHPEIDLVFKLATRWPYKYRLPGLDLFRLMAVVPTSVKYVYPMGASFVDILLAGSAQETPPEENHVMMAIRAFANLFDSSEGRALALEEFEKIHGLIHTSVPTTNNRNILVAVTTVYINYSVLFTNEKPVGYVDLGLSIVEILFRIISHQIDSEVIYRALVALGTLLGLEDKIRYAVSNNNSPDLVISKALAKSSDPRIQTVGLEALDLLKTTH